MKRVLGYYKVRLKNIFLHALMRFRLRLAGHRIGKGSIFNSVVFNGKCDVRDNASVGPQVELANNVIVGSGSKISNLRIGENSHIEAMVICTGYGNGKILIGRECYIGINNILDWSDNITIGDYVQIAGPTTALWTHSGAPMCMNSIKLNNKSINYRPTAPIIIENNVYIGGNCTIYPGIKIGHHSIIAPNSAVTKNIEPYTLAGGVPAKPIKKLNINTQF